ncbi:MAG: YHS domain-containing protein [Desulfatiglandales bacterium]
MTTLENKTTDPQRKTIDPVCGMDVVPGKTKFVSIHRGTSYWFCAEGCHTAFETNPDKYLKSGPGKKKGWFGRYLESMAKINKNAFGCSGPKCH